MFHTTLNIADKAYTHLYLIILGAIWSCLVSFLRHRFLFLCCILHSRVLLAGLWLFSTYCRTCLTFPHLCSTVLQSISSICSVLYYRDDISPCFFLIWLFTFFFHFNKTISCYRWLFCPMYTKKTRLKIVVTCLKRELTNCGESLNSSQEDDMYNI